MGENISGKTVAVVNFLNQLETDKFDTIKTNFSA